MTLQCAECGADLPRMARWCEECGAPNPARRSMIVTLSVVGVLVLVLPAIAIAIYAALQWERPLVAGGTPAEKPLPSQSVSGSDANFDWLAAAMKACDTKAAQEPDALHMLVVPMTYDQKDLEQLRRQALNRIGNAMVLSRDDMLAGLRSKLLTVATGEYTFSIRDDKTQEVRKWDRLTGVKWLSVTGAQDIASFRMQYKPSGKGVNDSWGNPLMHQKGNCYWVNAIYED